MMRRAVLVPFILAAVVSVARAEEVTSEGWGGFIAWREWAEWGMDNGVEEQPAYIYPAEYLEYGTKLLECTNIHLSTQAEASIRISLLKLDWGGQRVPRWPGGPPATIPVYLHTHLEISADWVWDWQEFDEQVDATFDFDDGQFAYYSVNVNRDEDLEAGWRDVVSEAIFGRMISPWEGGPLVIVHQWISPEWGNEFPEPDWRMDTWGDFTASITISIEPNEPPVAVATADPVEVAPGDPVTFSGAQSTDPNDDPLTYTWEFSDGETAQGVEVQHAFDEPGQQGAILTVDDGRFAYDETFAWVLVKAANEPPVAMLSVEPEVMFPETEVTFHTTGTSDPDEEVLTYTLDFGDGTPPAQGALGPPYGDLALKHTYNEPGEYAVYFTIRDPKGSEDTADVTVLVATLTPCCGATGTTVQVEIEGTDFSPDTSFGDGIEVLQISPDGSLATLRIAPDAVVGPRNVQIASDKVLEHGFYVINLGKLTVWDVTNVQAKVEDTTNENEGQTLYVCEQEDGTATVAMTLERALPAGWEGKALWAYGLATWPKPSTGVFPGNQEVPQALVLVPEEGEGGREFIVIAGIDCNDDGGVSFDEPRREVRVVVATTVDLDVDSDRDGEVKDSEDEENEDKWNRNRGAVVLVNCDNDDAVGQPGIDNRTVGIDNLADEEDMTPLVVRKLGMDPIPTGMGLVLKMERPESETDPIDTPATRRVRVYRKRDDGMVLPVIGFFPGGAEPDKSSLPIHLFAGTGAVELWIEGLEHAAQVDFVLELYGNGQLVDSDRVRVMTSPLIFTSNIEKAEKVYVQREPDPNGEAPRTPLAQSLVSTLGTTYVREVRVHGDPWVQDQWQLGFSSARLAPVPRSISVLPTVLSLPRGLRPLVTWGRDHFPGPVPVPNPLPAGVPAIDDTYYGFIEKGRVSNNASFGGNIAVSPPVSGFPFGRIIVGSNMTRVEDHIPFPDKLTGFLASQRVQAKHLGGKDYSLIELNVDWLEAGHVDEITNFVPAGAHGRFGVLIADPRRAYKLLRKGPSNRAVFYTPGSREEQGRVMSATGTSLTVNKKPPGGVWSDGWVRIYDGTGQGQVAHVTSWAGNKITVDKVWVLPYSSDVYQGLSRSVPFWRSWEITPDWTSRFVAVERCHQWLDNLNAPGYERPFPALTTAKELLEDTLLWQANFRGLPYTKSIENLIWDEYDGPRQAFWRELRVSRNVKRVPVIYMCNYWQRIDPKDMKAVALTPNLVNLQPVRVTEQGADTPHVFVAMPSGPRRNVTRDTTDVLRADVDRTLRRFGCIRQFADVWGQHRRLGGLHCATNVRHTPPQNDERRFITWWENWPE